MLQWLFFVVWQRVRRSMQICPTPPPSHTRKRRRVGETRNSSATGSEQKCSKQQNVKREEPRKHQKAASMWTQVDLTSSEALFPEADYSALRLLSPVDLFELLFSDDVWKLMVSECTRYALFSQLRRSKSDHWRNESVHFDTYRQWTQRSTW